MNVLLTGASGLVGSAVARIAALRGHTVTGLVHRHSQPVPGLTRQWAANLAEPAVVEQVLHRARPEAIVHCAAISEPGDCDANPDGARRLNVDLPTMLAAYAQQQDCRLVHVSTDQVFDGRHPPYRVSAPVAPLNRYGELKAESERVVQARAPTNSIIVRAPLLLGNSPEGRRSVHERLLADWTAARVPRLFTDEIRQVAHADNLASVLVELCGRPDLTGLAHWAGTEPLSRHQLGLRIRARFELSATHAPLLAVARADLPELSATRPADLRLELEPLRTQLQTPPQNVDEQLAALEVPLALAPWWRTRLNRR